ncbi:hypothetical protein [Arthrobacter sp. 9AX]|uniref:hypothetical protein n=1 Tax=Arthrobacter sp. 9AX TaxID=2653131 RepID=UPI00135782B7|nr:hypothetical protein [Arthrobacter sp. 9AX]
MAAASLVGPLGFGFMQYRTSDTTINQLLGSDAAALFVVFPATILAAALVFRDQPAGRLLGSGIGVYAIYTYAQVVIGQEYLRLPGNVEYWFPLLLAVFVLAEAAVVLSLLAVPRELPSPPGAVRTTAGVSLLLVAAFLVVGQHLRSLLTAWANPAALTEYSSSPTPFWMVKLMDLGIIVPVAVASGVGLLLGAKWALKIMYPLLTGYAFLAASVASMAVVMFVKEDPDASLTLMAAFMAFALLFVGLALMIYRPFFARTAGSGQYRLQ